jgi:DNA-binding winged helix-turn-helix (wHTH) protein/Flp pilus assembly protein TadD
MKEITNADIEATKSNKVTRYLIDDLNLDVQRGELTRNGEALTLPKLSYDLLVALANAAPALLSQQELMQKVWPDRVIGDETLKQRVKLLRKTLGDNASDPQYIEAVRGRGYRLIPQVTCECVIKRSPSVMLDLSANDLFPNLLSSSIHRWWRRASYIGLLLFSIIVSTAILTSLFYQQEAEHKVVVHSEPSISLLEEQVGKSAYNLYERGREYYKRYRAQDNKIAIDFYRRAIIEKPSFSEAYAGLSQAYSQEYFQFGGNEKSKQSAIDNAYLAISYNNNSADAYKALGTAYYVSGWLSKSINALLRAEKIAVDDRETLTNLAFIYSEQGKFEQALFWHKKALQADPDYAVAMLHLAITLQRTDHFTLALQWYQKAFEQQPDYLLTTYHLTHLYIELEQFEKARGIIEEGLLVQPEHPLLLEALADSYFYQGKTEIASVYYQKVTDKREKQPLNHANILLVLLEKSGLEPQRKVNKVLGEKLKEQLVTLHLSGSEKPRTSLYLAEIYAVLDDEVLAMRYLVQALEQGQVFNYQIENSNAFIDLKKLQRYKKLQKQKEQGKSTTPHIDKYFVN